MPLQDLLSLLGDERYHPDYDIYPDGDGWRVCFTPDGEWELSLYG